MAKKQGKPRPPEPGKLVTMPEWLGGMESLFVGELTPTRAKAILRAAAYGDPSEQFALFDTMIETDGHLASVYRQRRMALTGKDWELLPANQVGKSPRIDARLAEEARDYCLEILAELDGFETAVQGDEGTLPGLSDAIGRGLAVSEVIWERVDGALRPVAIETVDCHLLTGGIAGPGGGGIIDARAVGILTGVTGSDRVPLDAQPPGKFLLHAPYSLGGNRFRGGLLRGAVIGFMAKRYARKWWLVATELFGLPLTIAKYGKDADAGTKAAMLQMIRDMGVCRGGVFPVGSEVELIASQKAGTTGEWPQERVLNYVDEEYSKEFVGQTLTTQQGETGARSLGDVHDRVRSDLTADDARREGATLRQQLLVPLTVYRFGPEAASAAPYFGRVFKEHKDPLQTAQVMAIAVNQLGAEIPAGTVEDELGLRLATDADREAALPGGDSGFAPVALREMIPAGVGARRDSRTSDAPGCGCELHAHRALTEAIARRRSGVGRLAGWIAAAVIASQAHTSNVAAQISAVIERRREAALAELPGLIDTLLIDDLVDLENELLLMGKMAGMTQARSGLGRKPLPYGRGSDQRGSGRLVAHAESIGFERVPFPKAVEALRERLGLTPEEFEALDAEARSRAWRVAGVWNMELLAEIHTELATAIDAGETSRDFRLRLPQMLETRGWVGENPWHADLVQYQNFAMSHAAGRYSEYRDLGVNAWRYAGLGDSCPICTPLVGKVFALSDRRYYPPLHFWCDCEEEPVFDEELAEGEIQRSADVPNPALEKTLEQASAFQWDPAQYANLEPIDLGKYPPELREAFAAFAERQGWEVRT